MIKNFFTILIINLFYFNFAHSNEIDLPKSNVDFSRTSLNKNILQYKWKIDNLRSVSNTDIYYLKKKDFILYCAVYADDLFIETTCDLP